MMRQSQSWLEQWAVACLIGLLTGCAPERPAADPKSGAAPAAPPKLAQLFPFVDSTVSQFETENDFGEKGILILEIGRPRTELAELTIAGRTQRLAIFPDRIDHAGGGTLIELPLEEGRHFRGSFGTVTIESTTAEVQVPAGRFKQCLVLSEESVSPPKRSRSVYCRDVGLVKLEVESFGADGGSMSARLTHHGPRIEF